MTFKKPVEKRPLSERVEREHENYLARIHFCARNFPKLKALLFRKAIFGSDEGLIEDLAWHWHFLARIPAETMDRYMIIFLRRQYKVLLRRAGLSTELPYYY